MEPISNNQNLEPWVSPDLIELKVEQTAHNPGTGHDGDFFPDCSHS